MQQRIKVAVLLLFTGLSMSVFSAETIFTENFGSPELSVSVSKYTGYDNPDATYEGTAMLRNTAKSIDCVSVIEYGNVLLLYGEYFHVSGINTTDYNSVKLTFGMYNSSNKATADSVQFQVSEDGANWTDVHLKSFSSIVGWYFQSIKEDLPSTNNLHFKMINKSKKSCMFRIDNFVIAGVTSLSTGNQLVEKSTVNVISGQHGKLFLELNEPSIVEVYTMNAYCVAKFSAEVGITDFALPAGFYIVKVGNEFRKVIIR